MVPDHQHLEEEEEELLVEEGEVGLMVTSLTWLWGLLTKVWERGVSRHWTSPGSTPGTRNFNSSWRSWTTI